MKFYQFLKIWKDFNKEKEKTLMQQSMRKEKQKSWTLFYNRKMQEISKGGSREKQIARNDKL